MYDFATDPFWISLYMGKLDFLSVYKLLLDENKGENKNGKNRL